MSSFVYTLLVFAALVGLGGVFLRLEARTLRAARGAWRVAAIAPAMVVGWIILGILVNPAAHSLWPIEIVLWLVPAVVVLLFIDLMVRSSRRVPVRITRRRAAGARPAG